MDIRQVKDISTARTRTTFDPKTLRATIWPEGRRDTTDKLVAIMSREPILNKDRRRHLSRQELLEHGYAIQLHMIELCKLHRWNHETFLQALQLIDDHVPFGLHYNAFMPVLQSQGSDEQIAEWLPKCESLEVIGCYAQTELGHGSNVQGLETTATFDAASDAFILDSPTLTSAKWWVGGMGTVANHAVVQAQLIIAEKNFGPHLFIVPLRDQKTHRPFKGIHIGDIGPKHYGGFNMNDNGFARFDKVSIPRSNFLSRYAKVDKTGRYSPAGHAKIGYGSMVALRAGMPTVLGLELAKCVTIAIRYTTVRRQFTSTDPKVTDKIEDGSMNTVAPSSSASVARAEQDSGEWQVIRYASVKERLVPLLAASYAYVLAGHATMILYKKMLAALVAPPHDASTLAEVHMLTAGLKAVLSWNVVAGMEESRKALGGHGFSIYSGIGERFAREVPGQTYEGDNYVLVQQTAKALLKNAQLMATGKVSKMMPSAQFLASLVPSSLAKKESQRPDFSNRADQLRILALRVGGVLQDLARQAAQEPWSACNMSCVRLTRAFIDHHVATLLVQRIDDDAAAAATASLPRETTRVLQKLADVFILDSLRTSIADLAEFDILNAKDIRALRRATVSAINALDCDLIGLTDAFEFSDWELNSVLGRHDGNVYRELWRTVNEDNPINTSRQDGVVRSFDKLIRPLHETAKGIVGSKL